MQPVTLEAILPHLWISGRSSRAEWWRVHLICAVLLTVFEQMFIARLEGGFGGADLQWISLLWAVVSLALAWVSFASVVRRMHDRGKSGWWALLYFVPFIGWVWLLIECGFLPGKPQARPAPVFTPMPAPAPVPASRSAARLQATPRAGTIQRLEYPSWDAKRALKLAGNAIGFIIAAFILYKAFFDPNDEIFTELRQPTTLAE
jgi:uncharacterized membrane protein YhaH (DUF805 family)